MEMNLIRTQNAGVFVGVIKSRVGNEIELLHARRIWYWAGAASLSQLAMEGTSKPNECKFPCPVDEIVLLGVIEIIKITPQAEKSINEVPVWKA